MVQHFAGIFYFPVLCTNIFETANVFFFLCVNRDDWLSILQILMSSMVNKFKLFITVGLGMPTCSIFDSPVCCSPYLLKAVISSHG